MVIAVTGFETLPESFTNESLVSTGMMNFFPERSVWVKNERRRKAHQQKCNRNQLDLVCLDVQYDENIELFFCYFTTD